MVASQTLDDSGIKEKEGREEGDETKERMMGE